MRCYFTIFTLSLFTGLTLFANQGMCMESRDQEDQNRTVASKSGNQNPLNEDREQNTFGARLSEYIAENFSDIYSFDTFVSTITRALKAKGNDSDDRMKPIIVRNFKLRSGELIKNAQDWINLGEEGQKEFIQLALDRFHSSSLVEDLSSKQSSKISESTRLRLQDVARRMLRAAKDNNLDYYQLRQMTAPGILMYLEKIGELDVLKKELGADLMDS
ncbi:MAG: hypothetical protein BGO67_00260 [Alphaproteobacteria bacterium 41-28]|nr:MAG: hypothetical protein BGO67_00260 [Alphaproteobacteria bacterium 41-28]